MSLRLPSFGRSRQSALARDITNPKERFKQDIQLVGAKRGVAILRSSVTHQRFAPRFSISASSESRPYPAWALLSVHLTTACAYPESHPTPSGNLYFIERFYLPSKHCFRLIKR